VHIKQVSEYIKKALWGAGGVTSWEISFAGLKGPRFSDAICVFGLLYSANNILNLPRHRTKACGHCWVYPKRLWCARIVVQKCSATA